MSICKFINLDLNFYRENYTDLRAFSDARLVSHYERNGYREGRLTSAIADRQGFLGIITGNNILEIGPFYNPLIRGRHVKYVDVLATAGLREKAKSIGKNPDHIPHIDYVVPAGNLSVIHDRFDAVCSSHNIEHQPDLIGHLKDVARCLSPGGKYYLIIPNAAYCYDASLPLTKISEIFNAVYERRTVHTIGSVIEHWAMTTHNKTLRHWQSKGQGFTPLDPDKVMAAIREYEQADGGYIDVHAWQFTPLSFSNIMNCLIAMGAVPFRSVTVNGPVYGRNEFTAILAA